MSKKKKTSLSIECVLGEIRLVIGDIKVELSLKQARELSELLQGAACHTEDFEDEDEEPQCPLCGYTKADALQHGDHKLCPGKIPKK